MRFPALTLALVISSASAAPPPAPEDAVRKAFADYQRALKARDGKAAAAMLDSQTLAYYGQMKVLALEADRAALDKRPLVDRLMVLRLRTELAPDALAAMSPAGVVAHAVSKGWVGQDVEQVELGKIELAPPVARAEAVARGRSSSIRFEFRQEGGAWKMNTTSLLALAGPVLARMAQQMGMTEDEFVLFALEQGSGKKPAPGIWDAPRAPAAPGR